MTASTRHRLALRTAADTAGKNREVLAALESSGEDLTILRLVANSPTLLLPMVMMANALMQRASLPAIDREVVILHMAHKRSNTYEWEEHVPLSEQAGVTEVQRRAIEVGEAVEPPAFTVAQRLGVAFADELLDTGLLSEGTWRSARDQWGEAATLDLLFSVAFWGGMVPIVVAGLGLLGGAA